MARFTQYTQAAPCVCYGRGYVIDQAGDFASCIYCEAGAEFAATFQPADGVEVVELASVIAGPAREVAPAVKVRKSVKFPGMTLERKGSVLTFRVGLAFITYAVVGGDLRVLDAMDRGYIRPAERQHIAATAKAYAQKAVA